MECRTIDIECRTVILNHCRDNFQFSATITQYVRHTSCRHLQPIDAVSHSDHSASKARTIWKGCGIEVSTTKFNLISRDLPGETEENKDDISQDSRSSDEALNPGLPNKKKHAIQSIERFRESLLKSSAKIFPAPTDSVLLLCP